MEKATLSPASVDKQAALVAKLRYMGKQYAAGQVARGGAAQKHCLEEAADEIEMMALALSMEKVTPQSAQENAALRNVIQVACIDGLPGLARAWEKYFPDHPISIKGAEVERLAAQAAPTDEGLQQVSTARGWSPEKDNSQAGAMPNASDFPAAGNFAEWARVWHDTASAIATITGGDPNLDPKGMIASVQNAVQLSRADVARDAARYAWLRKQHWSDGKVCVVANPKSVVKLGSICPSHELLDDICDGAQHEPSLDSPLAGNHFNGDTAQLVSSINALLGLYADGAIAGPGAVLGGHARTLLVAAAERLAAQPSQAPVVQAVQARTQKQGPLWALHQAIEGLEAECDAGWSPDAMAHLSRARAFVNMLDADRASRGAATQAARMLTEDDCREHLSRPWLTVEEDAAIEAFCVVNGLRIPADGKIGGAA